MLWATVLALSSTATHPSSVFLGVQQCELHMGPLQAPAAVEDGNGTTLPGGGSPMDMDEATLAWDGDAEPTAPPPPAAAAAVKPPMDSDDATLAWDEDDADSTAAAPPPAAAAAAAGGGSGDDDDATQAFDDDESDPPAAAAAGQKRKAASDDDGDGAAAPPPASKRAKAAGASAAAAAPPAAAAGAASAGAAAVAGGDEADEDEEDEDEEKVVYHWKGDSKGGHQDIWVPYKPAISVSGRPTAGLQRLLASGWVNISSPSGIKAAAAAILEQSHAASLHESLPSAAQGLTVAIVCVAPGAAGGSVGGQGQGKTLPLPRVFHCICRD